MALLALFLVGGFFSGISEAAQEDGSDKVTRVAGDSDTEPPADNEPAVPPEDAVILFDGQGVNRFLNKRGGPVDWPLEDGALISTRGESRSNHVVSQVHFRDAEIHVEFMLPEKGSGNSGVYVHGNYELQIINSAGKPDEKLDQGDMGAVYGFAKPLVNASREPGVWQVYDIHYQAPRRDASGKIVEEGKISAWLNGRQVQKETRLGEPRSTYHPFRYQTTPYLGKIAERQKRTSVGPVFLQDHDNAVRFRNVWIRPLDDQAGIYDNEEITPLPASRE